MHRLHDFIISDEIRGFIRQSGLKTKESYALIQKTVGDSNGKTGEICDVIIESD
jgi:hypothetical protein